MKLYKISQNTNNDYDTYSEAVVACENELEARYMHPDEEYKFDFERQGFYSGDWATGTWVLPKDVMIEYIGEAKDGTQKGTIVSSFHAG